MRDHRDRRLSAALGRLDVPVHRDDFFPAVWAGVDQGLAQSGLSRRPRLGRSHLWRRHPLLMAASVAVAAVAVAAVLLVGLPGIPSPQTVSAAEVLRGALGAYSSLQTWQADMDLKWYDEQVWTKYRAFATRRAHLVWAADGSGHETWFPVMAAGHRLTEGSAEVWNAATGIGGGYDGSEGTWSAGTNGPLGPPDVGTVPGLDLATTVRALASSKTLRLDETVVDGRPAWTVTCTRGEMAGLPAGVEDQPAYTVLVDKQTSLLLGADVVTSGRLTLSLRYLNVRVNQPLPDDAFTFEAPPGVRVLHGDGAFQRVTLDDAAAAPGVAPLVPRVVPEGYALSQAAVADRAAFTIQIGEADEAFRGRHVFVLQYRRGFDALTVSTRTIVGANYTLGIDPCDGDQAWSRRTRTEVPLMSGAFVGVTARILVGSISSAPHLWAVKDGVLLTIAGAASAEELRAAAESLRVYPGP